MLKKAEEIDELFQSLLESKVHKSSQESGTYQIPVKIGKAGAPLDAGDQPWIVGTFLPNQFVNERHPQGHNGVDLRAPKGTPIYPIGPGTVVATKDYAKGGHTCNISHEDGKVSSYYAHMDKVLVSAGQKVESTTVIGLVGDTGNAKGLAHLHFEISVEGKKIDPMSVINKPLGSLSKKASLVTQKLDYLLEKYI